MHQWSHYGAYALVQKGNELLLVQKKSGPYRGLWDLPGGGIEFGESPEEAVKRELLEEVLIIPKELIFVRIVSHLGEYEEKGIPMRYHHIAFVYGVDQFTLDLGGRAEEEGRWFARAALPPLTFIAEKVVHP